MLVPIKQLYMSYLSKNTFRYFKKWMKKWIHSFLMPRDDLELGIKNVSCICVVTNPFYPPPSHAFFGIDMMKTVNFFSIKSKMNGYLSIIAIASVTFNMAFYNINKMNESLN